MESVLERLKKRKQLSTKVRVPFVPELIFYARYAEEVGKELGELTEKEKAFLPLR